MKRRSVCSAWAVCLGLLLPACTASPPSGADAGVPQVDGGPARSGPLRILFIGNSLTSTNNLPAAVQALAKAEVDGWGDVQVAAVDPGGKLLAAHVADLHTPGTALNGLLGPGSAWDFVVIQEQSQVPGLDAADDTRKASMAAAVELASAGRDAGATPVLYMTWGFWSGDAANPAIYPDFSTMSARLEQGYRDMAAAIQPPPRVAPVGLAFRAAFEDSPGALDAGSLFRRLYADDRHPTPLGTFLASAVIVETLSGERMGDAGYRPGGLESHDVAQALRWADEVVFDARFSNAP